jgi:hypothetical protein
VLLTSSGAIAGQQDNELRSIGAIMPWNKIFTFRDNCGTLFICFVFSSAKKSRILGFPGALNQDRHNRENFLAITSLPAVSIRCCFAFSPPAVFGVPTL